MFKTTIMRQLEAIDVAASAREFKDLVQQGLETLLAGRLADGESLPDLRLLQELIGRLLDSNGNGVLAVDRRYTSQLVNAAALRARRNELVAKLRTRLRDVRYVLDRSLDGSAAKAALRDRRLSVVKPAVLVQGARDLVETLRDPELAWEEMEGNPVFSSAATIATTVEAEANELEEVLMRLLPQKKANQKGLGAKVAGVEAAADINRRCAEALFGLYRLARLDFHAERLRPKARQRRIEAPDEVPPKAAPPPAALMRIN